ncbi:MAG: DUF4831 family protein [Paludibacteraceae bacterium]
MKYLLILCGIFSSLLLSAQTITSGQSSLIYALPKTELVITAYIEKVTETPGEFYQYSDRYLAETNVIKAKNTFYRFKNLSVSTRTVPDKERTFSLIPGKKSLASLITVNEQGLLCGINVPSVNVANRIETPKKLAEVEKEQKLLPLNEEYMLAGSLAKMAEGAAKQIYRIRENRIDLMAGDVEYVPTDGASMKTMIEQMNEQEKRLTELFTGSTIVEEFSQNITYIPTEAVYDQVAFRFSSFEGIVPADDLSGTPFYISVAYQPIVVEPTEKKKKVKEEVFSILPVAAKIQIENNDNEFFNQDLVIPQLGILMPLPLETMDKYSKAYVSPETGRLLSVEQGYKK